MYSKTWKKNKDTPIDKSGKAYETSADYVIVGNESFATYYIRSKYHYLDLKIAAHESSENGSSGKIIICGENEELLEEINIGNELESFRVDLKESKFITIKCDGNDGIKVLLMNAELKS